jgi:hypothetical protein
LAANPSALVSASQQKKEQVRAMIIAATDNDSLYILLETYFDTQRQLRNCETEYLYNDRYCVKNNDSPKLVTKAFEGSRGCKCPGMTHLQCWILELKRRNQWEFYCSSPLCTGDKLAEVSDGSIRYSFTLDDYKGFLARTLESKLLDYWTP